MTTLETVNYELYTPPTSPVVPTELEEIVAVTQGVKMIPLSGEKLQEHELAIIAKLGERVIGYCAKTYDYFEHKPKLMEVGSVTVVKDHRKEGIATEMVLEVTSLVHGLGHGAIAFCNDASASIFEKAGYIPATEEQIPKESIDNCSSCPMQKSHKNGICCDKIYINTAE